MTEPAELITAGIAALAQADPPLPALPADAVARLVAYLALLAKWNRTYNLTAIREPERMVTHHLLDALAVLPHLAWPAGTRLLDVGSGAGIPGIPLAIARPDWQVVLLDSNRKKMTFTRQVAVELGLANVKVAADRVEAHAPGFLYDLIIARAYADLATFARGALPLLAPGGQLVAMKGVRPDAELAALSASGSSDSASAPSAVPIVAVQALTVPGLDAARHLVLLTPPGDHRRIAETQP